MSETKTKKTVRRSVAIALGIICIILIAGMVEIWLYCSVQDIKKDETITNLNNEVFNKNSQISNQNSTISSLNSQLAILQNQVSNIHILNTENSTVWVDNQTRTGTEGAVWDFFNVSSAGYVSILISSNYNSTIAETAYTSKNLTLYDYQTNVGFGGIAVFPVLPSDIVVVEVRFSESSTAAVTAIYCY
jgi:cell division protein FtsL